MAESRAHRPEPPSAQGGAPSGHEVWRDVTGQVCATGTVEGDRYAIDVSGVGRFTFGPTGLPTFEGPRLGTFDRRASARRRKHALERIVLPFVAQVRGDEVLHGSAVNVDGGVIGFVGPSCAGKSTFAGALDAKGHPLFADDALVVRLAHGRPRAVALPCSALQRPATHAWLSTLAKPKNRQAVSSVSAAVDPPPLLAIFVLQVARERELAEIEQLPSAVAFRQLLSHAKVFSLGSAERNAQMAENFFTLVERVPVFSLARPEGFAHFQRTVKEIERIARGLLRPS